MEDYVVADLLVTALMDYLAGNDEIVVCCVAVVEDFDIFDNSFFFKLDWNAVFEVVQDMFGVFGSCCFQFQLVQNLLYLFVAYAYTCV